MGRSTNLKSGGTGATTSWELDTPKSLAYYEGAGLRLEKPVGISPAANTGTTSDSPVRGAARRIRPWPIILTSSPTRTVLTKISIYLVVWSYAAVAIILFTGVWDSAEDVARIIIGGGMIAAALAGLSCIRKL